MRERIDDRKNPITSFTKLPRTASADWIGLNKLRIDANHGIFWGDADS
jgi:hypothetical protein